jgi:hypothetical protein
MALRDSERDRIYGHPHNQGLSLGFNNTDLSSTWAAQLPASEGSSLDLSQYPLPYSNPLTTTTAIITTSQYTLIPALGYPGDIGCYSMSPVIENSIPAPRDTSCDQPSSRGRKGLIYYNNR